MSSQTFLWGSFLLPWLSLFFLKQKDIRRYMPVALFSVLITTLVTEVGTAFYWWLPTETIFPLVNMPPFIYGAYLVGTIWIFKYTYGNFGLYLATNIVIDSLLTFFLANWMVQLGVFEFYISGLQRFILTVFLAVPLYGYQMWQEPSTVLTMAPTLQPAAAKPLNKDDKENN